MRSRGCRDGWRWSERSSQRLFASAVTDAQLRDEVRGAEAIPGARRAELVADDGFESAGPAPEGVSVTDSESRIQY